MIKSHPAFLKPRVVFAGKFLVLLPFLYGLVPLSPAPAETPIVSAPHKGTPAKGGMAWVANAQQRSHLLGLGVEPWLEHGYRGQGLKVAILDSGFRGYRAFL